MPQYQLPKLQFKNSVEYIKDTTELKIKIDNQTPLNLKKTNF